MPADPTLERGVALVSEWARMAPGLLPLVVGLTPSDPIGVQLCSALGSDAVYDGLLGLTAEPDWNGLVVGASGTAFRPDRTDARRPVRLVLGVGRLGGVASSIDPADNTLPTITAEPAEGLLLDCCRRVFRLGTPPPPRSTAALHNSIWLDALTAVSLARPSRPLTWAAVATYHPAAPDLVEHTPEDLIKGAAQLARAADWVSLRASTVAGVRRGLPVQPHVAAWMDDGLFARWCQAALPDRAEALVDLGAILEPDVLAAVRLVSDAAS
jgi:hypothetical protein